MKFGSQIKILAIPEWQAFYIHYSALKKILDKHQKRLMPTEEAEESPEENSSFGDNKEEKKSKTKTDGQTDIMRRRVAPVEESKSNGHQGSTSAGAVVYGSAQHPNGSANDRPTNRWYEDISWLKRKRTKSTIEKDFFFSLEYDIDRVEGHYLALMEAMRKAFQQAQLKFYTGTEDGTSDGLTVDVNILMEETQQLLHDLRLLRSFVEVNRTAIRKILKKHDKIMNCMIKVPALKKVEQERAFFDAKALKRLTADAVKLQADVAKVSLRQKREV
eukprot:gb/GEZN01013324.1/.p1 GENE.gb/GEZN01013324.1/~~gb/GEZN01013324.1/.p1  ORF type:complete len:274 (+),score=58.87 gb/GEZN01013324.1/:102-923(+)